MMNSKDLQTNLEGVYYNGAAVGSAVENGIFDPANTHYFEWVEVTFPDGQNRLCIVTPAIVGNGPGRKYKVIAAK